MYNIMNDLMREIFPVCWMSFVILPCGPLGISGSLVVWISKLDKPFLEESIASPTTWMVQCLVISNLLFLLTDCLNGVLYNIKVYESSKCKMEFYII